MANFSDTNLFLTSTGPVALTNPTSGIGYAASASGGAVTQSTSRATAVTCTGMTGAITVYSAALASLATVAITVTDTSIRTGDVIVANHTSGGTVGAYMVTPNTIVDGTSFKINLTNITAGSLTEAPVISFAIIRAPRA